MRRNRLLISSYYENNCIGKLQEGTRNFNSNRTKYFYEKQTVITPLHIANGCRRSLSIQLADNREHVGTAVIIGRILAMGSKRCANSNWPYGGTSQRKPSSVSDQWTYFKTCKKSETYT